MGMHKYGLCLVGCVVIVVCSKYPAKYKKRVRDYLVGSLYPQFHSSKVATVTNICVLDLNAIKINGDCTEVVNFNMHL